MTHQLAAGCAIPESALLLTVQLLFPAISKIMMLVRSKNLGMAAPMTMLPIRSRRYCAGRVIYGDSYRYPQPNFTFVCHAVTSLRSAPRLILGDHLSRRTPIRCRWENC